MNSQSSSLEMDCFEPCSQDVEERSLTNTVEMTSVSGSLESNMDLSEGLEDGNEDGNDDQDDSSHSDNESEGPPSQVQSPVSWKVTNVQVQVKTSDGSQEVSSDYGSQEDASCQTKSPITVKVQTTSTNGSQEVTADNNNGSQGSPSGVQSTTTLSFSSVQVQAVITNGSQELSGCCNNGSQEIVLNNEIKICLTMSPENSTEKQSNLKRKSDSQEEEDPSKENQNLEEITDMGDSQGSSLEMECSEPYRQDADEQSLSNTQEMRSLSDSQESSMELSQPLDDGNNEQDNQEDGTGSKSDTQGKGVPTPRVQSPINVMVSLVRIRTITTNDIQESSADCGSGDIKVNVVHHNEEPSVRVSLSRNNSKEKSRKRKTVMEEGAGQEQKKVKEDGTGPQSPLGSGSYNP